MDWRHEAICRDEDPELFFPVGTGASAVAQAGRAKLICNRCPVTAECLNWALKTSQDSGVWGAASEDERRDMKRLNVRRRVQPAFQGSIAGR